MGEYDLERSIDQFLINSRCARKSQYQFYTLLPENISIRSTSSYFSIYICLPIDHIIANLRGLSISSFQPLSRNNTSSQAKTFSIFSIHKQTFFSFKKNRFKTNPFLSKRIEVTHKQLTCWQVAARKLKSSFFGMQHRHLSSLSPIYLSLSLTKASGMGNLNRCT
jgi:hypothetical protein